MDYAALKIIHIVSAVLSISGFAARGVLMLRGSSLLGARCVRIAPHVVDTVLLTSAIALAWLTGQYPFAQAWLTAKVVALLAYIVLGAMALRRGPTLRVRAIAFVLALCTVLYIVCVAITRQVSGPFALFS